MAKTFGIEIDKGMVRRILAAHDQPGGGKGGPSWHVAGARMPSGAFNVALLTRIFARKVLVKSGASGRT